MLDPRIYRTGLVAVALAVIVVAFSLGDQQGPARTTIPPEAFNGQNAYLNMVGLARKYPDRRPGSPGDDVLATVVARALHQDGFIVSTRVQRGRTVDGNRPLVTVSGVRTGLAGASIVIVSHRDALGSPATADLSGTAVMLELARVLSGETQHRSVVLVSTSGSVGAAGAAEVARSLPMPIDAVIALGDLAGRRVSEPVLTPWSNGRGVAPTMLRNTVAAALASQASLRPGGTSLAGEMAHLAFPLSLGEQGPFGARGLPAVLLSLAGERAPAADEPVDGQGTITALGRTVLQTVNALDGGPTVPAPSAYLLYDGKVVPAWAIRLLVLALILPVVMTTVDGLARARRRGYSIARWVLWVLLAAVPFMLALGIVVAAEAGGLLMAPPSAVRDGAVPIGGGGTAVLVGVALVIVLGFLVRRPVLRAMTGGRSAGSPANPGGSAAVLLLLCAAVVAIWAQNPFAAALIVPALHLWMWALDPDLRLPRAARVAMLVVGAVPPVLVVLYYAHSLDLGPLGVAWDASLLVAGGQVAVATVVEWSIVLACLASATSIVARIPKAPVPEASPVTVRGPVTYAGPGSLGGTESALRR